MGRVIEAVPGSRLLFKSPGFSEPANRDRLTAALARAGIDPRIASMRGHSDRASHLAACQEVDLALDSYPHGGGMTTLEALAMGVPVLTVPGQTISSRLAAACLSAVGLTEFIADDPGGLAACAARKAANLDALAALRASLPALLSNSPVGDARAYTCAVETAYREMWREWCGSSHVHHGQ
jgi:protein O-GlcNAc transferase